MSTLTLTLTQALHPDMLIKDNDPRMRGRKLRIVAVGESRATCRCHRRGRTFNIRIDRIHTDGKPRRSGFDVLTEAAW